MPPCRTAWLLPTHADLHRSSDCHGTLHHARVGINVLEALCREPQVVPSANLSLDLPKLGLEFLHGCHCALLSVDALEEVRVVLNQLGLRRGRERGHGGHDHVLQRPSVGLSLLPRERGQVRVCEVVAHRAHVAVPASDSPEIIHDNVKELCAICFCSEGCDVVSLCIFRNQLVSEPFQLRVADYPACGAHVAAIDVGVPLDELLDGPN
mmetsp:Transcript_70962/g.114450  ORF Transcript_70962/g.114450 Transcript_70962/m.114450 type:complete len:209 (+) Transcript_70962:150-776(+)